MSERRNAIVSAFDIKSPRISAYDIHEWIYAQMRVGEIDVTMVQIDGPERHVYRESQEECARLRESVPYVKVYQYNPKHLYPKLNGYGDNGQRMVRSFCGSTYCTCSADALRVYCACP